MKQLSLIYLKWSLTLLLVVVPVLLKISCTHAQDLFNDTKLHEISITFDNNNWFETLTDYYASSNHTNDKKTLNASFAFDGEKLKSSVAIRFKGQYSYSGFSGKKKPFRINLGKIDKNQTINGTKKLNLHNLAGDPSFLREYIAYDFLRSQGIPASRTAFAKLYINDEYWGCYLIVEEPEDDAFLEKNFGSKAGNLFEADTTTELSWKGSDPLAYTDLKLQTKAKTNSWDLLIKWMDLFNNNYDIDFQHQLSGIFEIDSFFKILATDIFMDNWDSYSANGRNFFIYEHPETQKLNWVPWDYNLSFWEKNLSAFPRDANEKLKPLIWRIYNNTYLNRRYLESICRLINFTAASYPLTEKIEKQKRLITDAVAADPNRFYSFEHFSANSHEAVTVTMLRGGVNKQVYLPGLIPHWQKRRNGLRRELSAMACNCDEISEYDNPKTHFYLNYYPNPTLDILHIYTELSFDQIAYTILNIAGKPIKSGTVPLHVGKGSIDCSLLPGGNYFILLNKDHYRSTFQISKQ